MTKTDRRAAELVAGGMTEADARQQAAFEERMDAIAHERRMRESAEQMIRAAEIAEARRDAAKRRAGLLGGAAATIVGLVLVLWPFVLAGMAIGLGFKMCS